MRKPFARQLKKTVKAFKKLAPPHKLKGNSIHEYHTKQPSPSSNRPVLEKKQLSK